MNTEHATYPFDTESVYCQTHHAVEPRIKGVHYSEILLTLNDVGMMNLDTDEAKAKIATIREFVSLLQARLTERDSYKAPAVAGIASIEDDFTFLQWVLVTRELLWN
jgi:hypothetical protein